MSPFWKTWLKATAWIVILFGATLAAAGIDALSGPTRLLTNFVGQRDVPFGPEMHFTYAVMGAVTMGWGITLYGAFEAAHALGPRATPLWRTITAAVVTWFLVDSTLSVATGFALNAVLNLGFLTALLIPVAATGVLSQAKAA
jgi:hypothetical protein